jgi:hypothetical protein
MAPETDPDTSPKVRCPMCGATQARTLIRSMPMAYVRCAPCGMVWSIRDRRGRYPSHSAPSPHIGESAPVDQPPPSVLWRSGTFVCELRAVSDLDFPAVLVVLKESDVVLEVPVLTAVEAEERALGLRVLVERHEAK